MTYILAVGIATVDIINTTNGFPREDDEVRALHQEIRRGGNATNAAVVLSQLGHQCEWIGCLAGDTSAKLIIDDLDTYGIDHSHCETHDQGVTPTSYITLNQKNGSRTIVHYRDLPELSAATFNNVSLDHFNWIHFEGRNVSETAQMLSCTKSKNRTIPVSIEIEKQRDNLTALFNSADIYFFSKAFATENNNFSNAEEFLRHYRNLIAEALLICTWGSEGAFALDNDTLYFSAAPAVSTVVDTIGAGDTFIAGFIHATLISGNTDFNLQARLDSACALAAKKCAQKGFKNLI